jgi:hypothetical protein
MPPIEPTHDHGVDELTGQLLESVDDLRAQVRAHVPAQVVKLKVAVIRDIADHLYAAIEDSSRRKGLIIRQGSSTG